LLELQGPLPPTVSGLFHMSPLTAGDWTPEFTRGSTRGSDPVQHAEQNTPEAVSDDFAIPHGAWLPDYGLSAGGPGSNTSNLGGTHPGTGGEGGGVPGPLLCLFEILLPGTRDGGRGGKMRLPCGEKVDGGSGIVMGTSRVEKPEGGLVIRLGGTPGDVSMWDHGDPGAGSAIRPKRGPGEKIRGVPLGAAFAGRAPAIHDGGFLLSNATGGAWLAERRPG